MGLRRNDFLLPYCSIHCRIRKHDPTLNLVNVIRDPLIRCVQIYLSIICLSTDWPTFNNCLMETYLMFLHFLSVKSGKTFSYFIWYVATCRM